MRNIFAVAFAAMVGVASLVSACDTTPTEPSLLLQAPGPPLTTRIDLSGPDSIPPGQTAQFTAIAHRADGTSADVTTTASWRSSQPSVLSIVAPGMVQAVALGEATIQVVSSVVASKVVFALPEGTFRLAGLVTEADGPSIPIVGAEVAVTGPGGGTGASVLSGNDGRYRLYGVPRSAAIRVTKAGYQLVVQSLTLSDHQTLNFSLPLAGPRLQLAGNYTLSISAAAECRDKLPEQVWTRRYRATVTQSGPLLDVALAGATFVVDGAGKGDGFRGRIEPDRVVFVIDRSDYYYYRYGDIVEEIEPSLYLTVSGSISAAVTPTVVSGALNGAVITFKDDPRKFPPIGSSCSSSAHQFVLSR